MKETELLPDFLRDVFGELLGYTGPAAGGDLYTLKREALVQVDGKYADAALGRFGPGGSTVLVAVEGKGPRDPLDRPFGGRKRSPGRKAIGAGMSSQGRPRPPINTPLSHYPLCRNLAGARLSTLRRSHRRPEKSRWGTHPPAVAARSGTG